MRNELIDRRKDPSGDLLRGHPGRRTANSSPPKRAPVSFKRKCVFKRCPMRRSASSRGDAVGTESRWQDLNCRACVSPREAIKGATGCQASFAVAVIQTLGKRGRGAPGGRFDIEAANGGRNDTISARLHGTDTIHGYSPGWFCPTVGRNCSIVVGM
jgi:hypothetical protein